MVVADNEPPAVREHPAEALLPPQHRCTHAHDEEDRRVGRVTEWLGAKLDPVRLDHALGQPCFSLWTGMNPKGLGRGTFARGTPGAPPGRSHRRSSRARARA